MAVILRVLGFANGADCPIAGEFVKDMDFEAFDGRGDCTTTRDPRRAKRFADVPEALEFWQTIPKCRPFRPDGLPNRPLTASHMAIFEVDATGKPVNQIA